MGCQAGAEASLKSEVQCGWPDFRPAFSRPGFVTFKLPVDVVKLPDYDLRSTFARCWGFSLGMAADNIDELTSLLVPLVTDANLHHVHLWNRKNSTPRYDTTPAGEVTIVDDAAKTILAARPDLQVNYVAPPTQPVVDAIFVDPGRWWIGMHRAASVVARWPGGFYPNNLPLHAVSRAYLKTAEALSWSRLPFRRGELCAELGSAPGGSSQYLLEQGLRVIGVDPAEMDEAVLNHGQFRHVRRRARQVRRRDFDGVKWLLADSNITPHATLDMVENIVSHKRANLHGLLLTLKIPHWDLAEELNDYRVRVSSWGFEHVKTRQLSCGGQEICLVALRRRAMMRKPRTNQRRKRWPPTAARTVDKR